MPNGKCRMHGGASPGAPKGEANGNYRHGLFTQEAIEDRREIIEWVRLMKKLARQIESGLSSTSFVWGCLAFSPTTPPPPRLARANASSVKEALLQIADLLVVKR